MQWVRVEPYLEDDFLERVRRAYRRAIAHGGAKGPVWSKIDALRADIHAALISDDVGALRGIFSNPSASDLFYGFDVHCRSVGGCHDAATLFDAILADGRTRSAVRLVQRVERAGIEIKNAAVVELGPGMGRGAYAAYRAGLTDYTTIDLPLGLVAQACFIGKLLGPDAIWFAGEAALNVRDRIRLHCPGELPERRFGVALNVDSLTEMSGREAFDYAHWLGIHATTLISINHTSNFFPPLN